MANMTFTLEQARQNPASFLYVFADFTVEGKKFLEWIEPKYRKIISGKRANQQKVLLNSAIADIGTNKDTEQLKSQYQKYLNEIREGFIDIYGVKPEDALVKLALGETVAGKNWEQGVYGVNGLGDKTFKGTDISVNPDNGYMMRNGKYLPVYDTVYEEINKKTVAFQLFYYDEATGNIYMSQYYKGVKKYYAQTYTTPDGKKYNSGGKEVKNSESASIWENINFDWNKLLDWVASILNKIFGLNIPLSSDEKNSANSINADNTLPSQTADGFCITESGFSEAATIALIAVAAGTLLAGGLGKKKSVK